MGSSPEGPTLAVMDDVYELFRRGTELLEAGHNHQATIPLSRARDLAPDKTSIREALGRALFRSARYEQACREFVALHLQPSVRGGPSPSRKSRTV